MPSRDWVNHMSRGTKNTPATRDYEQLRNAVLHNRRELEMTLDAIEYKLNIPKRVAKKIRILRKENPVILAVGVVAVTAVIGTAVWLTLRSMTRR